MSRGASLRVRDEAKRERRLVNPGDVTLSAPTETVRVMVYVAVVGRASESPGLARIVEVAIDSDGVRLRSLACVFAALGEHESRVA